MFSPATPAIFLDVDGVLIAHPEGAEHRAGFTPRCVEAFRTILDAIPSSRVVFSSTWRLPPHLNRLHAAWIDAALDPNLCLDGTPDLRETAVPHLHRRGEEIKAWLRAHPEVQSWVILDDDQEAIKPVLGSRRCVFTDPARGLEFRDAERAIEILRREER